MRNDTEQSKDEIVLATNPRPQGFRVLGAEACLVHRAELNRAFNEFRLGHYTHSLETLSRLMKNLDLPSSKNAAGDKRFDAPMRLLQASAITLLGRVHERLRDHSRAREEFSDAVRLFQQVTRAVEHWRPQDYNNYGIALERNGRKEDAVATLLKGETVLDPEALRIIGVDLQEKGEHKEALEYLVKAIDADPYQAQLHRTLAESLTSLKRKMAAAASYRTAAATQATAGALDEALSLLEVALKLNPSDPETLAVKGEVLRVRGDYKDALIYLNKSLKIAPHNSSVLGIIGQVMCSLGEHRSAVKVLRKALTLDPNLDWAYAELGASLLSLGRSAEALKVLEKGLKIKPGDAFALGLRGQALRLSGQYERANQDLKHAIKLDPALYWAVAELGLSLIADNLPDEAVRVLDEAITRQPENLNLLLAVKGEALHVLGRTEEALEALEESLSMEPDNAFALGTKGSVLLSSKSYPEAIQALKSAVQLGSHLERDHINLSTALIEAGNYDEALETINNALALKPKSAAGWRLKGKCLGALRRSQEALEALEKSLSLEPGNAFTLGTKGRVLRTLGRHEEAIEVLQRALEIEPTLHLVLEELCYALGYMNQYEKAIEIINEALKREPDYAFAWRFKGEALRRLKRFEEALEALDSSLLIDPEHAWTLGTKGQVLRALGRGEEAVTALKRALELPPHLDWLHGELGFTYYLLDNYEEALPELNLSTQEGFFPAVARVRGNLLCDIAEYEAALEEMERAIQHNPKDASFYSLKGFALENIEGRAKDALEAYKRAAAIEPKNSFYQMGVANALYLLHRFDAAGRKYARALKYVDSMIDDDNVRCSIAGWCHHRLANYEEAISHFKDALTLYPEGLSDHLNLALTLLCYKRYGLAIREYELSIEKIKSMSLLRQRGLFHMALDDIKVEIGSKRISTRHKEVRQAVEMFSTELTRTIELLQEASVARIIS